jgi:hypothetical protein
MDGTLKMLDRATDALAAEHATDDAAKLRIVAELCEAAELMERLGKKPVKDER